ncbi:hypothetical protein JN531_010560 [Flagellatimonas centrodinii]|uniref:hypothetical protein n=1 Tax=Flagellatimonas centrodinii TaxID=2806210 RepID=UPI001FEE470F|nr:hypothetical protein [Flagellatimonas centrodinii]ULQ45561.1 hypothetical protein JN531_010560 [Flagellatimonas centrodinii]
MNRLLKPLALPLLTVGLLAACGDNDTSVIINPDPDPNRQNVSIAAFAEQLRDNTPDDAEPFAVVDGGFTFLDAGNNTGDPVMIVSN